MDLQEKYDELDNIIRSLDVLIDEVEDENFKHRLQEIKWDAENEIVEIEQTLYAEHEQECKKQEKEYWGGQL